VAEFNVLFLKTVRSIAGGKPMSDATRLQNVILSHLLKLLPDMMAENRLTLAMMITGLLRGRNGQLKKMARAVR
jgi:hypothetical protein